MSKRKTAGSAKARSAPVKGLGKKTPKTPKKAKSAPKQAVPEPKPNKGGRPRSTPFQWPVAETIAQASQLLGWPEAVFKQLKRAGAPGFKHSRIYFAELLPWIGQRGIEDPNIDWADRLKRAQAKREELRLAQDQERLADRDEIDDQLRRIMAAQLATERRFFCSEFPAMAKGRTELEIRALAEKQIEQAHSRIREQFAALAKRYDEEKATDEKAA